MAAARGSYLKIMRETWHYPHLRSTASANVNGSARCAISPLRHQGLQGVRQMIKFAKISHTVLPAEQYRENQRVAAIIASSTHWMPTRAVSSNTSK